MKKIFVRTAILGAALTVSMTLLTMRAELADNTIGDIARGNMAEISLSQVAVTRSQNEAVRQFAQMMVTDHTAAGNELQSIATSKSITLPTAMDQKHQSAMTKLGAETGTEFDRDYMKQMVNDHEKMLSLLQKEANSGTDADLKAFAAKTAPTVQSHLTAARSLYDTIKGTSHSTGQTNMNSSGGTNMSSGSGNSSNSNRSSNRSNSNSNRRSNTNGNTNSNSNGNSNRPL
jgi:predicted outer membrane protein